jgi:hypothetical protein
MDSGSGQHQPKANEGSAGAQWTRCDDGDAELLAQ